MSVPSKRRASSQKRRRASHFALKPKNLISAGGQNVPHGFKKAVTAKKKLKLRA